MGLRDESGEINAMEEAAIVAPFIGVPLNALVHWFFIQGFKSIHRELYIPGVLSIINGIEISLRLSLHLLAGRDVDDDLARWEILKKALLARAYREGLPIIQLAFPGENIVAALPDEVAQEPRIVTIRNNLCHGNAAAFTQAAPVDEAGDVVRIFTPECLRELSGELTTISLNWARELTTFLNGRNIRA